MKTKVKPCSVIAIVIVCLQSIDIYLSPGSVLTKSISKPTKKNKRLSLQKFFRETSIAKAAKRKGRLLSLEEFRNSKDPKIRKLFSLFGAEEKELKGDIENLKGELITLNLEEDVSETSKNVFIDLRTTLVGMNSYVKGMGETIPTILGNQAKALMAFAENEQNNSD